MKAPQNRRDGTEGAGTKLYIEEGQGERMGGWPAVINTCRQRGRTQIYLLMYIVSGLPLVLEPHVVDRCPWLPVATETNLAESTL